ncbi:MAG: queuosine precursor transporter [Acidobacteriia bacterium]|nr:queuosine precursor transporter [Terriglobia bacterium]
MKNYRYLAVITGLFTTTLLLSNTLDTKIFMLGPLALPAGIVVFPLAYVFGDILTEVYGYAASRKVIWTGFGSLLIMVLAYELVRWLPPAPFWNNQLAYVAILGQVPRIAAASITAYFAGEFCNSYVLAKMKVKMGGRRMSLRFVLSTVIGQFVDTVTFVVIAFTGVYSVPNLISITASAWFIKVAWEILALPITLPFTVHLKRVENEDYYDRKTNFNPFLFTEPSI